MTVENQTPLVSIIINNYNYGHFVHEAIESALSQTYQHTEIIVVDDGSTDNSLDVIASYKDRVVPVLKDNGGQASAFNAGFAASRGEIICLLDSDDLFLSEKVTEIVKIFAEYPDIGWCFHRLRFINAKTGDFVRLSRESGTRACDFRAQIQKNGKLAFYGPATSGLCFKRSLLQKILPMPEMIRITSDNYLKTAALGLDKGYFLDNQLAILRLHGNNHYTDRPNNQPLEAKIAILTAYCLRNELPSLTKHANKLFSHGMGVAWKTGGITPETSQTAQNYLSTVSPWERLEINMRAIYHCIKP